MKKFIILLILSFTTWMTFAQEINIVKEGYFIMYDDQGIQFDQKATEAEAIQGLFNYQVKTGLIGTYVAPSMRIDFKDIVVGSGTTDTIYVNKDLVNMQIIDTITVAVFPWAVQSDDVGYYKALDCSKLYQVAKDSTISLGVGKYDLTLLRTKDWPTCETTYDYISHEQRFHITIQSEVLNNKTLHMAGSEMSNAWWDIYDPEFPQQMKHSDVELSYRWADHNMSLTDWDPGSSYEITGYLVNEARDTITSEKLLYTHPDVDIKPLIGFQYYTVWVPVADLTSTSAKLRTWTTEQCSIQIIIGKSKFDMVEYPMDKGFNASHPGYWQHGRTIEGLDPDTTYYFEITNVNEAGVQIRSSIHSFKTLP